MIDHSHDRAAARSIALASLPWLAGPLGSGWKVEKRSAQMWCETCGQPHDINGVVVAVWVNAKACCSAVDTGRGGTHGYLLALKESSI